MPGVVLPGTRRTMAAIAADDYEALRKLRRVSRADDDVDIDAELSLLERETLRRGCLTLESAAHEESFCVWHLVRFLEKNSVLQVDGPALSAARQTSPALNDAFLARHGRTAVRGAQVTNAAWVVLAKLARVLVCRPSALPPDQLARQQPAHAARVAELMAAFADEQRALYAYCAHHAATRTNLFPDGCPSSHELLASIQRSASTCARELRAVTTVTADARDSWTACERLLQATLDMARDAGGFLDLVSWLLFGSGGWGSFSDNFAGSRHASVAEIGQAVPMPPPVVVRSPRPMRILPLAQRTPLRAQFADAGSASFHHDQLTVPSRAPPLPPVQVSPKSEAPPLEILDGSDDDSDDDSDDSGTPRAASPVSDSPASPDSDASTNTARRARYYNLPTAQSTQSDISMSSGNLLTRTVAEAVGMASAVVLPPEEKPKRRLFWKKK